METVLMVVLMGAALYFLLIRPQQKRTKEQQSKLAALEAGSRVMTISGIIGTISHLGEKQAILEIAPGVEITIDKRAISTQPIEDEFEYVDADAEAVTELDETASEPAEPMAYESSEPMAYEPSEQMTFDPTPPSTDTEEDRRN